jgi:hypothetical protein
MNKRADFRVRKLLDGVSEWQSAAFPLEHEAADKVLVF